MQLSKKLSKLLQIGFHQPSSVKQKTLYGNWAARTRLDIHRKHVIGKYFTNNSIHSRFKLIKVNDLLQFAAVVGGLSKTNNDSPTYSYRNLF